MKRRFICYLLLTGCSLFTSVYAQSDSPAADKVFSLPKRWTSKIVARIAGLNQQLTKQTARYLADISSHEKNLQQQLTRLDPQSAQTLFAGSAQQYAGLARQLKTDTGSPSRSFSGSYQPYLDSLHGALAFLEQHPEQLNGTSAQLAQLHKAGSELQALEAKMLDADQVKAFLQHRKQQIGQYLAQHTSLAHALRGRYTAINKQFYYYSQELRGYKELWNNPDQLEQRALAVLNRTASFRTFMEGHTSLGSLFKVPGTYGSGHALAGLQTRDMVAGQLQARAAPGGPAGMNALQARLQSAQAALDSYKSKLPVLGADNGDADLPDFTPNEQHTKTLWRRLEYGFNFQTIRTDYYYPSVTDLGISIGYRLGYNNVLGIGASYKVGWGNGVQHIAFSSQGIGLRSFLQIKIKGSFSATGGFEYNYTTPFPAFSQLPRLHDWTKSGLIGVTKTITTKARVLKKTNLSLLWDFLSYRQIPPTQPFLFRVGYTLN